MNIFYQVKWKIYFVSADAVGVDMFLSLNLSVDSVSLSDNLTVITTNNEYKAEAERAVSFKLLLTKSSIPFCLLSEIDH
jgi:hypothetical protein